jgi:hypothetical protein
MGFKNNNMRIRDNEMQDQSKSIEKKFEEIFYTINNLKTKEVLQTTFSHNGSKTTKILSRGGTTMWVKSIRFNYK